MSIRDVTKILGRLTSAAVAVLPAPLQYRYLQRNQITELSQTGSFEEKITLSNLAKGELDWWIQNIALSNGKSLITLNPDLVISSDASKKGWGAACRHKSTGGPWSRRESEKHINVLEILAAKLAIMTFSNMMQEFQILWGGKGEDLVRASFRDLGSLGKLRGPEAL